MLFLNLSLYWTIQRWHKDKKKYNENDAETGSKKVKASCYIKSLWSKMFMKTINSSKISCFFKGLIDLQMELLNTQIKLFCLGFSKDKQCDSVKERAQDRQSQWYEAHQVLLYLIRCQLVVMLQWTRKKHKGDDRERKKDKEWKRCSVRHA